MATEEHSSLTLVLIAHLGLNELAVDALRLFTRGDELLQGF
jgi:hypothetical protein